MRGAGLPGLCPPRLWDVLVGGRWASTACRGSRAISPPCLGGYRVLLDGTPAPQWQFSRFGGCGWGLPGGDLHRQLPLRVPAVGWIGTRAGGLSGGMFRRCSLRSPPSSPGLFGFLGTCSETDTGGFDANGTVSSGLIAGPAIVFGLDFGARWRRSPRLPGGSQAVGGSIFRIIGTCSSLKGGGRTSDVGISSGRSAKDVTPWVHTCTRPGAFFVGMGLLATGRSTTRAVRDEVLGDSPGWSGSPGGGTSLAADPEGFPGRAPGRIAGASAVEDLRRRIHCGGAICRSRTFWSGFLGKVVGTGVRRGRPLCVARGRWNSPSEGGGGGRPWPPATLLRDLSSRREGRVGNVDGGRVGHRDEDHGHRHQGGRLSSLACHLSVAGAWRFR